MKNITLKIISRLKNVVSNEKGAQTLEWIAVGAVVVTIAAFLATAFGKGEGIKDVVDAVITKIKDSL